MVPVSKLRIHILSLYKQEFNTEFLLTSLVQFNTLILARM